ncbi:MAG: hypothetical protein RMM53_05650 [Bacteroidia bacterium]|nr:hypothetical protein [Bacteroidia bacterium]
MKYLLFLAASACTAFGELMGQVPVITGFTYEGCRYDDQGVLVTGSVSPASSTIRVFEIVEVDNDGDGIIDETIENDVTGALSAAQRIFKNPFTGEFFVILDGLSAPSLSPKRYAIRFTSPTNVTRERQVFLYRIEARVEGAVLINGVPTLVVSPCFGTIDLIGRLDSTSPDNGTFTGNGVSGYFFNPTAAGVGVHPISYSGTFAGCPYSTTFNIQVQSNDQAPLFTLSDFTGSTGNRFYYCQNTPVSGSINSDFPGGVLQVNYGTGWEDLNVENNAFVIEPPYANPFFDIRYAVGSCITTAKIEINRLDAFPMQFACQGAYEFFFIEYFYNGQVFQAVAENPGEFENPDFATFDEDNNFFVLNTAEAGTISSQYVIRHPLPESPLTCEYTQQVSVEVLPASASAADVLAQRAGEGGDVAVYDCENDTIRLNTTPLTADFSLFSLPDYEPQNDGIHAQIEPSGQKCFSWSKPILMSADAIC